jgi:hypothetical protein
LGIAGFDLVDRARVHIEHRRPAGDLRQRVLLDGREIARSSSAASFLRPVGLIRSPITQNGSSKADDGGLGLIR